MAYVNVLEWKAEQVAEWLQGLDDSIFPYSHFFINNNVTGRGLLNITVDDLYKLHVEKMGHQEIILEGLEHLKNLHHNLDTENMQYVCLKLSCKARSLFNELRLYGPSSNDPKQKIPTASMSAAADVLDSLWNLILWLDRPPFRGQQHFDEFKRTFLKIGVELATSSQRDTFAEKPVNVIKGCCEELADLSDTLIRDVNDPIILQPASLDIATAKRRTEEDDFGIVFDNCSPSGVHTIAEIVFQSPAHQCGRIQPGDEIVQINYQTVVGWHQKKVLQLMDENPFELILTLKKRPRHLPVFGQIYMKPFRIPARNKSNYFNNLPSPRAELLVAPNITFPFNKSKAETLYSEVETKDVRSSGTEEEEEEDLEVDVDAPDSSTVAQTDIYLSASPAGKSPTHSMRSRTRSAPQRRATISGSSPSHYKPYINIAEVWGHIPKSPPNDCRDGETGSRSSGNNSSRGSTLRSGDSGHATLEGESLRGSDDFLRWSHEPQQPQRRPQTVGPASDFVIGHQFIDFSDPKIVRNLCRSKTASNLPPPPPVPTSLSCETEYVNLEAEFGDMHLKNQPVPKPRKATPKEDSPNRKKPIPQPRNLPSASKLIPSSSLTQAPTPKKDDVCPVPTSQFKSFKRVTASSALPDYVNTTPPPPPSHPPPPLDSSFTSPSRYAARSSADPGALPPRGRYGGPVGDSSPRTCQKTGDYELMTSPSRVPPPYYVSNVYKEQSEDARSTPFSPGSGTEDVDSQPPPVPDRLYEVPFHHRMKK